MPALVVVLQVGVVGSARELRPVDDAEVAHEVGREVGVSAGPGVGVAVERAGVLGKEAGAALFSRGGDKILQAVYGRGLAVLPQP